MQLTQPLRLTVVTAVHNAISEGRGTALVRCVESVSALKTEHEHLIYDCRSTDGTVELLRDLEKRTPNLHVLSEPDTGIYNALNKGVRDAKGEWFYVLGCDDRISHTDVLDRTLADSERFDVIAATVESGGKAWQFRSMSDLRQLLWGMPYCHQGIVMRTGVCRGFGGFDESYRIVADYDMMWKAHESGLRFKYSFEPFADFSSDGASFGFPERMEGEFAVCRSRHLGLISPVFKEKEKPPLLPLCPLLPLLFHRDYALRTSARFFAKRWLKNALRQPLITLANQFRRGNLRKRP